MMRETHLLPEVDVENFSGEVEVDVGVVGIISSVGDCEVQRHVLHSSQSQVGFVMEPDGKMK